ncbi:hypothetical protein FG05_35392 [Fusarium graminearum]|nr:hypothetical protein FG05_35392 [Fusarium graminearum]
MYFMKGFRGKPYI